MLAPAQEQRNIAASVQTGGSVCVNEFIATAKTTNLARRETIRSAAITRPHVLFAACITAFVWILMPDARADFRILKRTADSIELFISGTITERDAKAIEALS
jgi:hypothetical protein